jgi:hypothetical protein
MLTPSHLLREKVSAPFVSSSSIRSEITKDSTTGWFKETTQSAAQPVRSSAASDSVACCDITTVKPPDFVPDPHRTSGCVTAPGGCTLQWPTIWLITNHRPIACKSPFRLEICRSQFWLPPLRIHITALRLHFGSVY